MSVLHPLANSVEHPAALRDRATPWLVIAGLFAAPVGWSMQLLISYGLDGDSCAVNSAAMPGLVGLKGGLLVAIGLIAIAVCLAGLAAAYRVWRVARGEGAGDHFEGLTAGIGRTRFLGLAGMVAAAFFTVGSAFGLLVPFLESPCLVPFF